MPGVEPVNPHNAVGSQCRGTCGADCAGTCRSLPTVTQCHEWQTADCGWHAKVCTYAMRECGSAEGCRVHDACYDACAAGDAGAACRSDCDDDCIAEHGLFQCGRWAFGYGPFDRWIQYGDAPTSYTYDSTCY
ncbi:MAG: hypothetical protein IPL61_36035 [Myxococcales bacterium]|nr:hypothetical protein [Myxococcales bacterium]